jgi:hypothetical protein
MAAYPNTLAITAANELVNGRDHLNVTPVIKAVVRDLKRHLLFNSKTKGTRILPVGYSSAAVLHINYTPGFLEYLYYGDKEATVDFWSVSRFVSLGTGFRILTMYTHSSPNMAGLGGRICKSLAGTEWYACFVSPACGHCALIMH